MITHVVTLALISLALLHQVFGGVFAGGTVLCVEGASGFAVQPLGMTCCTAHAAGTAAAADPCCDTAGGTSAGCPVVTSPACGGCTDYLLTVQIALPVPDALVALPPPALVVIAVLEWPKDSVVGVVDDQWVDDRAPPPLAFLRTVVLRC